MAVDHEHPLSHGYCGYCRWGRKTPFSHWVGRSLPAWVTPWCAGEPTSGLPSTMLHTSFRVPPVSASRFVLTPKGVC